jgi:histidinol-phosphate aminotransferase
VIAALRAALDNPKVIRCYPEYGALSAMLGAYAGVSSSYVLPTNGSDQAIDIIFRGYAEQNDEVIIPAPSFATFFQSARLQGCRIVSPEYSRDFGFPLEAVEGALSSRTRLVVVCNPNNPTGTIVPVDQILALASTVAASAPDALILVDECYLEFSGVTVASHLDDYPNLCITRTLSKTWALAGLRIGYVLAHPTIITELCKVRGPYDVNAFASIAAQAALADPTSMREYAAEVASVSRPLLCDFLDNRGVPYWQSGGNFVLVHPPYPERCCTYFAEHGIRLRPRSGGPIEGSIRISLGTAAETAHVIEIFAAYLDATER